MSCRLVFQDQDPSLTGDNISVKEVLLDAALARAQATLMLINAECFPMDVQISQQLHAFISFAKCVSNTLC